MTDYPLSELLTHDPSARDLPGRNSTVDILCDAHAGTAEGPLWDERLQQLIWTDIPGESIHFTELASGTDSARFGG